VRINVQTVNYFKRCNICRHTHIKIAIKNYSPFIFAGDSLPKAKDSNALEMEPKLDKTLLLLCVFNGVVGGCSTFRIKSEFVDGAGVFSLSEIVGNICSARLTAFSTKNINKII
jgi:hypothetical protein